MTMHIAAAFLAGFGARLLFAAIAWGRYSYRSPDRRHSFLTRRKWRNAARRIPFIRSE